MTDKMTNEERATKIVGLLKGLPNNRMVKCVADEITQALKDRTCEWKPKPNRTFLWISGCGVTYEKSRYFTHCPFCGGKIRNE